jgi:hypothetical protein
LKLRIFLIIFAFVVILFSCNGPTGPENNAPILATIGNQTVTAGQTKDVVLSATDADNDSLEFSIPMNPDFLSISGFSQVGDTATATLVIAPDDTILGSFHAIVQVSDKEGDTNIKGFMIEVEAGPEVSIFPGEGAAEIKLGNPYSLVRKLYGIPDRVYTFQFYDPGDQSYEYWHFLHYNSIKAIFEIDNNYKGFKDDDVIVSIKVESPYEGVTEELIGIGSSLNDVVDAYGQPSSSSIDYYKYFSRGITFYYEEGDTLVTGIEVYYPD